MINLAQKSNLEAMARLTVGFGTRVRNSPAQANRTPEREPAREGNRHAPPAGARPEALALKPNLHHKGVTAKCFTEILL